MKARRFRVSQAWPERREPEPARRVPLGRRRRARPVHRPQQVGHVGQRGARGPAAPPASTPPGAQSLTTQPWSVRAVRPSWKSPCVRMHRQARLGLAQPLDQVGDAGGLEQRRVGRRDRRLGLVDPVDHRLVLAQEGAVEGEVHARRHDAQRPGLGAEVAAGRLRRAARGVEVAQRGQGEGPAARAVRQRLLHDAEVAPVPTQRTSGAATWLNPAASSATIRSTSGRGSSVEPREHHQVATVAAVEHRGVVVVAQDGDRPGRGATPRTVASSSGPSCASRSASVHTASPSSSSSSPSAASSPERRKCGSSATPRSPTTKWARRPSTSATMSSRPGRPGAAPRSHDRRCRPPARPGAAPATPRSACAARVAPFRHGPCVIPVSSLLCRVPGVIPRVAAPRGPGRTTRNRRAAG